jgi:hypothetical protein
MFWLNCGFSVEDLLRMDFQAMDAIDEPHCFVKALVLTQGYGMLFETPINIPLRVFKK